MQAQHATPQASTPNVGWQGTAPYTAWHRMLRRVRMTIMRNVLANRRNTGTAMRCGACYAPAGSNAYCNYCTARGLR